jgi:hypothetical protein
MGLPPTFAPLLALPHNAQRVPILHSPSTYLQTTVPQTVRHPHRLSYGILQEQRLLWFVTGWQNLYRFLDSCSVEYLQLLRDRSDGTLLY